jgi:mannose/fructose/N-acetylgalactosamine-specific phosphotransferase system component IID
MSHLPVAEDPSPCETQGRNLLQSISTGMISAVSAGSLIVGLIVFIVVCLVVLNVNVITPNASLAIPQFGAYP